MGGVVFGLFVPNVGSTSPSGRVVAFGVIEDLREVLEVDGGEDCGVYD